MPIVEPIAAVHSLTKAFGAGEARVEALRGVDVRIEPGEFVAVMGPSGSGKSTLLHLIGGLDTPTSGQIFLGDKELSVLDDDQLTQLRRHYVGFVFQAFNLLDVLTAEENVALPLVIDGMSDREANERAAEALELVGVAHRKTHLLHHMSGGEQQRLAVARALATRPRLLLADEPTGNLDSQNGDQIMHLLRQLVDERGQTILMVTHNPLHAAVADRLIQLEDGHIVEEQTLDAEHAVEDVLEKIKKTSHPIAQPKS